MCIRDRFVIVWCGLGFCVCWFVGLCRLGCIGWLLLWVRLWRWMGMLGLCMLRRLVGMRCILELSMLELVGFVWAFGCGWVFFLVSCFQLPEKGGRFEGFSMSKLPRTTWRLLCRWLELRLRWCWFLGVFWVSLFPSPFCWEARERSRGSKGDWIQSLWFYTSILSLTPQR